MDKCGNRAIYFIATCARPSGHPGLHRNTKTLPRKYSVAISSSVQWGDNEGRKP